MPNSNSKPDEIFLDRIDDGRARLLVRWNIAQQAQKDEQISERISTSWNYSERIILWILPKKFNTRDEIRKYLDSISVEILDWAKATDLNNSLK